MEHAKKMVLVPFGSPQSQVVSQGNNSSVSTLPTVQTVGDNLSRLDSEIYRILTSNEFRDDHEKSKNYLQILRRYLHFKNSSIREPVITKNEFQDEPLDEEDFDPENKYKEK